MRHASIKARQKNKQNRTRIRLFAVSIVLIVLIVSSTAYLLRPAGTSNSNNQAPVAAGLQEMSSHYMSIMNSLNSSQTKTLVAAQLGGRYNQTELFGWEHTKLVFDQSTTRYLEDPIQILSDGKGVCFQWSIVYAAACLSQGYPCRLVAAVDTQSWSAIHMWTEVYCNGRWVHVDPSDSVWNNPQRYHDPSWGWGQLIGSQVRVYAFEDGDYQDVTAAYVA